MNYWLVGAKWDGQEEALDLFLERGYWFCYSPKDNKEKLSTMGNSAYNQTERFKKIKAGDRIAVKRRINGMGSTEMEILALGIAKTDMDPNEWRVYVDWFAVSEDKQKEFAKSGIYLAKCITFPKRIVALSSLESITKPYTLEKDKSWIQEIFFI